MAETGGSYVTSSESSSSGAPNLEGWWKFQEGAGTVAADSSGRGRALTAYGGPSWIDGISFGGATALDGAGQSWSTSDPVLRTDGSFSVAAWVRLDSALMKGDVRLPSGEFAITAVSQSGASHSPFYLGARLIPPVRHGTTGHVLRWTFTTAPIDGSENSSVNFGEAGSRVCSTPRTIEVE